MKKHTRVLALLFAICLLVSLFSGCGGNSGSNTGSAGNTGSASAAAGSSGSSSSGSATSGTGSETASGGSTPDDSNTPDDSGAADSPYNFAVGQYTVNEDGLPTSQFEYTMPLSTTDEVFTWWTLCYVPQYIPEDGYGSMNFRADMMKLTGMHIEWDLAPASSVRENFAVLMASDDIRDMSCNAYSYFTGTVEEGLEDYFVNLYDYKEYFPNYLYQVYLKDDVDVTSKILYDKDKILAFYCLLADPMLLGGYFAREDWLNNVGLSAKDIVTYDDLDKALTALHTGGYQHPLVFFNTIEPMLGILFPAFNTTMYVSSTALPYSRVMDGKVEFTLSTDDDLKALQMIRKWADQDLIYQNLHNPSDQNDKATSITTGLWGVFQIQPGEIQDYETNATDPNCEILALKRPVFKEGDRLTYGQKPSVFQYGSTVISQKCGNVPLIATFCDWWYSESGSFYFNYGKEGEVWEYTEDGDIQLTDFLVNNEMGMSWALSFYAGNGLTDHGLQIFTRKYRFEGGQEIMDSHYMWVIDGYKGENDFPTAVTYTSEEEEELNKISNDVVTYIAETMLCFFDGSIPLDKWDSYVETVNGLGLERCRELRQAAYDRFMERF